MSAVATPKRYGHGFHEGVPFAEYVELGGINVTALKVMARSPLHFLHRLTHPLQSKALTIGTTTHTAVFEQERFLSEYAMWDEQTSSGRTRPRSGKDWLAFQQANASKRIITPVEYRTALTIAKAVHADPVAASFLKRGKPEVTALWDLDGTLCRGRFDWLDMDADTIVGLKSTRDAGPVPFGNQSASLQWTTQWGFYADGFATLTGRTPRMIEIAAESSPPYDVAVYVVPTEVLDVGRDDYRRLLRMYLECKAANLWPGVANGTLQTLSLPTWAFPKEDADLDDLGLDFGEETASEEP